MLCNISFRSGLWFGLYFSKSGNFRIPRQAGFLVGFLKGLSRSCDIHIGLCLTPPPLRLHP